VKTKIKDRRRNVDIEGDE